MLIWKGWKEKSRLLQQFQTERSANILKKIHAKSVISVISLLTKPQMLLIKRDKVTELQVTPLQLLEEMERGVNSP